ncbi:MAG: glycosyltransferase family 4 protein [Gemmatimonadota bacterium]
MGRPVRVLFLAWGYSLHAWRRIALFADDPDFEVAVASPHDYGFPNAVNVRLADAAGRAEIAKALFRRQDYASNVRELGFVRANLLRARNKLRWNYAAARALRGIGAADGGTRRLVVGSSDLLLEVETGIADLRILEEAAAAFRPDVVFLQTLLYPACLAYYLPSNLPIMITFWNGDVTWWAQWTGTERLLKRQMVVHGVGRAAAMTVNSRSAAEACLGYGARADKVHLIRYPGVDRARFRPADKGRARAALGLSARKIVLCPRGLGQYLNSDVILEAAAAAAREVPDVLFLFLSGAGGEEELAKHRQLARDRGIAEKCRWDGQVPWESMPAYYAASDAMVSVSSNDSLPNCMMEAMACGVPVVLGDIPALREWVADGVNGWLAPPRDPAALAERILAALRDPGDLAAAFARRNDDLVAREFDGARSARAVKDLVRRVAGRSS